MQNKKNIHIEDSKLKKNITKSILNPGCTEL